MKLGFIIPHYPSEKRVALLPRHMNNFENDIVVEHNFGLNLDIDDEEYEKVGCHIGTREEIFSNCPAVFSLKLILEDDYNYIRPNQMIIGWTHPKGSGSDFMKAQSDPKNLIIVDLDNIHPQVYYEDKIKLIDWIKPNFIKDNSFIAGYSAVLHALLSFGMIPDHNTNIAVLGTGNVSQGAFCAVSKFNNNVRMFYRKTMHEFIDERGNFDIIINGIEVDKPGLHILSLENQKGLKKNCLVIDASANAGKSIEGTEFTSINNPIYKTNDVYYYVVNNTPSVFYKEASRRISESFSKNVYQRDVKMFKDLVI
jgi:N5-(carboxyethyl)ornithine synthase